jgi:hypothetical protein
MPSAEAEGLATALLASYPGSYVERMHILATADTLERCGLDIAADLVDRARVDFIRPPSTAQLHELAREIRAEEAKPEPIAALPEGEVLASMPEDVREKVKRMRESWRIANETADAELDEEWERRRNASLRGPHMRKGSSIDGGTLCPGSSEPPVRRAGKRVCRSCGVEVPDIIVRHEAKKAAS